jgi:hypothetical protein
MSPEVRDRLVGKFNMREQSSSSESNIEIKQSAKTLSPKREFVDRALSPKSIEAVSPREMQKELKEMACDPIDFEAEYYVTPVTPPKVATAPVTPPPELVIQK